MPTTGYHTNQAYHPPGWGLCTTTHYIGGAVYESKAYSPVPGIGSWHTNQCKGRLRAVRSLPQHHPTALVYDYMLKDHLGNVRMVLTDEQETIAYPALTFEGAAGSADVNNQNAVWENATGQPINVTAVRITSPVVLQNSGLQPPPSGNSMLVRSSTGKVGAGKLLKVMPKVPRAQRIGSGIGYTPPYSTITPP